MVGGLPIMSFFVRAFLTQPWSPKRTPIIHRLKPDSPQVVLCWRNGRATESLNCHRDIASLCWWARELGHQSQEELLLEHIWLCLRTRFTSRGSKMRAITRLVEQTRLPSTYNCRTTGTAFRSSILNPITRSLIGPHDARFGVRSGS